MKSLKWSSCSSAVISSSLPQVLILVEYFLGRALRTTGRTRGAYLAGVAAGGGGTFLAMMTGTMVFLGTTAVEEEELLGGGLFGLFCLVTIELQSGRGKFVLLLNEISKGSNSFNLSKDALSNSNSEVVYSQNSSLYFWVTKAEVSIPLLCRYKTISENSFSFLDLNKNS